MFTFLFIVGVPPNQRVNWKVYILVRTLDEIDGALIIIIFYFELSVDPVSEHGVNFAKRNYNQRRQLNTHHNK